MYHEGVKFMYECVMGLRKHEGQGCILADEMYVSAPVFKLSCRSDALLGEWVKHYRCASSHLSVEC